MRCLVPLLPLVLAACALFGPPPHYAVYFQQWSAELDRPARGTIAEAATAANHRPGTAIEVRGYAGTQGTPAADTAISAKRAQAVADALVADGVDPARIRTVALGATPPAPDSAQESRRVEIVLGER